MDFSIIEELTEEKIENYYDEYCMQDKERIGFCDCYAPSIFGGFTHTGSKDGYGEGGYCYLLQSQGITNEEACLRFCQNFSPFYVSDRLPFYYDWCFCKYGGYQYTYGGGTYGWITVCPR